LYCRGIEFRDGNQGVAAYVLNTPGAIGYASLGTADYFGLQRAWMMQVSPPNHGLTTLYPTSSKQKAVLYMGAESSKIA
jgi:ABC-type phosphate transport system substrate-binding protein